MRHTQRLHTFPHLNAQLEQLLTRAHYHVETQYVARVGDTVVVEHIRGKHNGKVLRAHAREILVRGNVGANVDNQVEGLTIRRLPSDKLTLRGSQQVNRTCQTSEVIFSSVL